MSESHQSNFVRRLRGAYFDSARAQGLDVPEPEDQPERAEVRDQIVEQIHADAEPAVRFDADEQARSDAQSRFEKRLRSIHAAAQ